MFSLRIILVCLCLLGALPVWAGVKLEVRIDGIEGELLDNAKAYLQLDQKDGRKDLDEQQLRYLFTAGKKQIAEALQPFGYFSAKVEGELNNVKGVWVVRYTVVPGPQVRVAEVDVKLFGPGAEEAKLVQAVAQFPVHRGEVLDTTAYDRGKDEILSLADDLGYPQTRAVVHRVRVDREAGQATIRLHIDTGPRFYLGEVRLHQDILDPKFLRRYIRVEPGARYSQETLLALQQAFVLSDYFSVVDVRPRFDEAEGDHVPVDIEMTAAKRHRLSFGLGYDTDVGPNGSIRWKNRHITRYGHQSETLLKLSEVESLVRFGYWIPVNDPRTDKLVLAVTYKHEDTKTAKSDSVDFLGGYFFDWRGWSARLFTELLYESFTAGNEPKKKSIMLSPGLSLERTEVEKAVFPRRGNYWFLKLTGSAGMVSDTAYLRGHVKTRYLFPVGKRGRFSLRGEVGRATVADFTVYPTSFRFFAGGEQSIRGYAYKSLGPEGDKGEVVGGKDVLTGSVEYDQRVFDDWVGALFLDAGNAYDDSMDKVYYGSGFGVRWLSPIGSVRLDIAWPLNRKDEDPKLGNWRLHFGFGAVL